VADNRLPNPDLSSPGAGASETATRVAERRAFLRRTALMGLPAVLASVRARTVWAQDDENKSCAASLGSSGCAERNGLA